MESTNNNENSPADAGQIVTESVLIRMPYIALDPKLMADIRGRMEGCRNSDQKKPHHDVRRDEDRGEGCTGGDGEGSAYQQALILKAVAIVGSESSVAPGAEAALMAMGHEQNCGNLRFWDPLIDWLATARFIGRPTRTPLCHKNDVESLSRNRERELKREERLTI
jgi:hypothetical protein